MALLGLHCCARGLSLAGGSSLVVAGGLLFAVAPLVAEHRLWGTWASVVVALGLVVPQHVESSRTRDQTYVPCIGRQILNYWTTSKILNIIF